MVGLVMMLMDGGGNYCVMFDVMLLCVIIVVLGGVSLYLFVYVGGIFNMMFEIELMLVYFVV